ncbi:hypothetical protein [Streptomyces sp. NPDC008125]|uniref:hypothetical protein n=1 Tax=Streptomyces sp. NPDC008125 TaxID=3364811 RepID=UPI0036EDB3AB
MGPHDRPPAPTGPGPCGRTSPAATAPPAWGAGASLSHGWSTAPTSALLTIDVPKGTSGTIAVPVAGRDSTVTVNGNVVWRHGTFTAAAGVTGAVFASNHVHLKVKQHGSYEVAA